jgi:Alpha/beta hydrolase family
VLAWRVQPCLREDRAMATAPTLVLVHSPLVGPLTWQPAADRLRALGYGVVVPSLHGVIDTSPPYYRKLAGRVAQVIGEHPPAPAGPVILVGHSGAGALLPAITHATGTLVAAAVFVDAILPHPGASWFATAPEALRDQLRDLAGDGWLPPWHQWFPPEVVAAELPDANLYARFIAELPRLPLAYFEERAPVIAGWPPARCGYLQLSAAYQEEADEAQRRGWLTLRETAGHLAMLTQPDAVAGMLHRLVTAMTSV